MTPPFVGKRFSSRPVSARTAPSQSSTFLAPPRSHTSPSYIIQPHLLPSSCSSCPHLAKLAFLLFYPSLTSSPSYTRHSSHPSLLCCSSYSFHTSFVFPLYLAPLPCKEIGSPITPIRPYYPYADLVLTSFFLTPYMSPLASLPYYIPLSLHIPITLIPPTTPHFSATSTRFHQFHTSI